jgi:hypothetical protein
MKLLLIGVCLLLSACGARQPREPFRFDASAITPAAMGEVATSAGPNGNTKLTVDVKHLAPPDRVSPGARVYVVWATELGTGAVANNLGALRVDAGLNGRLESLTPLRSFDLDITAEETPTVATPSAVSVLSVRITPRP